MMSRKARRAWRFAATVAIVAIVSTPVWVLIFLGLRLVLGLF